MMILRRLLPLVAVQGLMVGAVARLEAQTWQREDVDFAKLEERAKLLATQQYQAPDREALPKWMKDLSYDQYRDIRFRPDQALWVQGNLPFRAMFFHPGYLFREPVKIHEYTSSHSQEVRFTPAFFDYGPLVGERGDVPPDAGFAGFRLHAPLNNPGYYDELAVFQGASYWRALGKGQHYGLSARGLAINTGAGNGPEEFPAFREFWLRKPEADATISEILAIIDSPSVSGAFNITIQPGEDTVVTVRAVLFPRVAVHRFGVAPLSSMFWFGENSRRRFDDLRPEVHDSDGLAIQLGTGERIFRPLTNDSGNLDFSFFSVPKIGGFGLLQRDRAFSSYEDGEASYHQRPSVWIEPINDWGPGKIMLMEIPTTNELADNVVALWEPETIPQPGTRHEFLYRQHWTMAEDPSHAGGHVVATRTGLHDWQKNQRTMAVEFAGVDSAKLKDGKAPEAVVQFIGDGGTRAKIQGVAVQPLPGGRWRAGFQIIPAKEGTKLSDIGPLELRAALKTGDDYLTETWAYRINP
jgi:glucans biosynthesis protein